MIPFLFVIADERDAIQKKTFTKWVNKHLKKVSLSRVVETSRVFNAATVDGRSLNWRTQRRTFVTIDPSAQPGSRLCR